jgi:hypothetical protein
MSTQTLPRKSFLRRSHLPNGRLKANSNTQLNYDDWTGEVNAFSDGNDLGHFCLSVPKSFTFDSLILCALRVN